MSDPNQVYCNPTEKTLYEEPHDDHWGTWNDRLFQTGEGPYKGIGISDGCMVYVKPLKAWHKLAEENDALRRQYKELEEQTANTMNKLIEEKKRFDAAREGWILSLLRKGDKFPTVYLAETWVDKTIESELRVKAGENGK